MLVHRESNLEFGSDTVSPADKDRFLHSKNRKVEHSSERPDVTHNTDSVGGSHVFLDSADHVIARFEADACLLVVNCHCDVCVVV